MVRVKHRYLLLDILYPEPSSWPPSSSQNRHAQFSTAQSQLQIHAPTSDALTPSLFAKMIREAVAELFGDWGVGRLGGVGAGGVSVKYLSPATSTAIVRCPRASYRLVWMALTYMSRAPELNADGRSRRSESANLTRPCIYRVIKVSGTMRKAEEEAIRRARREIVRLRGAHEVGVLEGLIGGLEPHVDEKGGGYSSAVIEDPEGEDLEMASDNE